MAKFRPFTDYLLAELDALCDRHGLRGPFLDAGCGPGYVAAHLARRGWDGLAVDNSETALALAHSRLDPIAGVELRDADLETLEAGPFGTVLLFDVVEHIADDRRALRAVAGMQAPGGMLVLTVPTNGPREWRWDDDLWGHERRYEPAALRGLLGDCGYETLEMWDVTLPFFWLLRRVYTGLRPAPPIEGTRRERTVQGHLVDPWNFGVLYSLLSVTALWRPLFAVQRRFRAHVSRGHEMIVLARRSAVAP